MNDNCLMTDDCQEQQKQDNTVELVVFPNKLLNPIQTFRMFGDFHLYSDASNIIFNDSIGLGISCQSPYKKVSNVVIKDGKIIISYSQLDFSVTPWEYVVKRLESLNDSDIYQLSSYIKQYYESLKKGLKTSNPPTQSNQNYQASGLYKYKYIKEFDQFFITQVQYDLKLLQELGFNQQKFIESCLKYGIPEISLKKESTNQEYYKNVIEFTKPLINPLSEHEYYLYSNTYPQGLRTQVSFQVQPMIDEKDGSQMIQVNFYYNYNPSQSNVTTSVMKLNSNNCISYYYNICENQFNRCGLKNIKK